MSVRVVILSIVACLAAARASAAAPIEFRVVHDGTALHLVLPPDAPKDRKQREAMELDGWEALGPLMRATRKSEVADALAQRLKQWALGQGRLVSNDSVHRSDAEGSDALRPLLRDFRRGPRTAEQVALWQRAELTPAGDVLVVRYALESFAVDDGVEDAEFTLEWRSAPIAGADATARIAAWAAADAAAFRAALASASDALIAAFGWARRDPPVARTAPRGTIAGVEGQLAVVAEDAERVLALGDDDDLHSVPRAAWTPTAR